ncbi:hypothetical protein Tco_0664772 [Tanacetum coccineum]
MTVYGELGAVSDHSVNDDPIHDHIPIPSIEQVTIATQKTQPQVPKPTQTVDPSCAQHVKSPRQPIGGHSGLPHLFLQITDKIGNQRWKGLEVPQGRTKPMKAWGAHLEDYLESVQCGMMLLLEEVNGEEEQRKGWLSKNEDGSLKAKKKVYL